METNTLVTHKKLKSLGIGCVSRVLKNSVRVNFGTEEVKTCKPEHLEAIDVSKCSTISCQEYRMRILKDNSTLDYCIVGNELKHYVGIGWLTVRVVSESDLLKHPRVI